MVDPLSARCPRRQDAMRPSARRSLAVSFLLAQLGLGGPTAWLGCGTGELELQGAADASQADDGDAHDEPDLAASDAARDPSAGDVAAGPFCKGPIDV